MTDFIVLFTFLFVILTTLALLGIVLTFAVENSKMKISVCCDSLCTTGKVCVSYYYTKFMIYFTEIFGLLIIGNLLFLGFAIEKQHTTKLITINTVFIFIFYLLLAILFGVWYGISTFSVTCQNCNQTLPKQLIISCIVISLLLSIIMFSLIFYISWKLKKLKIN